MELDDQIKNWYTRLSAAGDAAQEEFGALSYEAFNLKPAPGSWSVADNLAHLIRVDSSYFPIFDRIESGKYRPPLCGRIGIVSRWVGNKILQSVQPDNEKAYKTVQHWEPELSKYDLTLLHQSWDVRRHTIKWLLSTPDLLENSRVITSPANRFIAYPLLTAWEIIVSHEERHIQQARRVKSAIESGIVD